MGILGHAGICNIKMLQRCGSTEETFKLFVIDDLLAKSNTLSAKVSGIHTLSSGSHWTTIHGSAAYLNINMPPGTSGMTASNKKALTNY